MNMPRTILAATDFSAGADCAVRYAFELAQQLGARVHLLHAYTVPALPDAVALGADAAGLIMAGAEQAIAREAERYRLLPEFGGAAHQVGDPRDVIVQRARQLPADLIVIGSHGRRGMQRLLLGSVAEGVVRVAPCPVLVVREGDACLQAR